MSVIRRRVVIHGLVQGVGFRYSAARRAETAGLSGFIRNRSDGAVEAAFEGPAEAVEAIVRWCDHGPRGAVVDRVEVASEESHGSRGFRVVA